MVNHYNVLTSDRTFLVPKHILERIPYFTQILGKSMKKRAISINMPSAAFGHIIKHIANQTYQLPASCNTYARRLQIPIPQSILPKKLEMIVPQTEVDLPSQATQHSEADRPAEWPPTQHSEADRPAEWPPTQHPEADRPAEWPPQAIEAPAEWPQKTEVQLALTYRLALTDRLVLQWLPCMIAYIRANQHLYKATCGLYICIQPFCTNETITSSDYGHSDIAVYHTDPSKYVLIVYCMGLVSYTSSFTRPEKHLWQYWNLILQAHTELYNLTSKK
jgi:hypothetical protein